MDVDTYRLVLGLESMHSDAEFTPGALSEPSQRSTFVMQYKSVKRKAKRKLVQARQTFKKEWNAIIYNQEGHNEAKLKLKQDLAAGKVRWYGCWKRDLWYFLRNTHPVVSVCYSHPLHPVTRKQRWFAYLLQMIFVLAIAIALAEARQCFECNIGFCTRKNYNRCFLANEHIGQLDVAEDLLEEYPIITKNFCCVCEALGILGFFRLFGKTLGGMLYAIVSNCLFTVFLFQMIMCSKAQLLDARRREIRSIIGKLIVIGIACWLFTLLPLLFFWISFKHMASTLLCNFVAGKLGSWTFVTCINVTAFNVFWQNETKKVLDGNPPRYNVTAEQFNEYLEAHWDDLVDSDDSSDNDIS